MPGAHLAPGIFCADLGKMKKTVDNRAKSAYNNRKAKSNKLLIEKRLRMVESQCAGQAEWSHEGGRKRREPK